MYIGKHRSKNIGDDGYLGSGTALKRAIKKYGTVNFDRKIISVTNSRIELNVLEIAIIAEYNAVKNALFYNMKTSEGGYPRSIEQLANYAAKIQLRWRQMNPQQRAEIIERLRGRKKNVKHPDVTRQDISIALRQAHERVFAERSNYKTEQGQIITREKIALHYTSEVRQNHSQLVRNGQARRLAEYAEMGIMPPKHRWYHNPLDPIHRGKFLADDTIPEGWVTGKGKTGTRLQV